MVELYSNNHWNSQHIKLDGTEEFRSSVKVLLGQIWAVTGHGDSAQEHSTSGPGGSTQFHNLVGGKTVGKLGEDFLRELDRAGHDILIKKGSSFACAGSKNDAYYKLAKMSWNNRTEVIPMLRDAINRSHFSLEHLAQQLASPGPGLSNIAFTPQQVKAMSDSKVFGSAFAKAGSRIMSPTAAVTPKKLTKKLMNNLVGQWEVALTEYLSDETAKGIPNISSNQQKLICRKLEPWLQPGKGVNCQVTCNFDSDETTCYLDGTKRKRPMAIALVHELIHAYYSVTGTRLYSEGTHADEALTAGLPPEHFRPYSENRFRAAWADERLDIRLFYSMGSNVCPYCGAVNGTEEKVKSGWVDRRNCTKCGLEVIPPSDLDGEVFHTTI